MDRLNRLSAALREALGRDVIMLTFDGRQWVTEAGTGLTAEAAVADALRLLKNNADAEVTSLREATARSQATSDALGAIIDKARAADVDATADVKP